MKGGNNQFSKTLVLLINGNMRVGGIETYIYRLSKYCISNGARVLISLVRNGVFDEGYRDIYSSESAYIVYGKLSKNRVLKPILVANDIQNVKIISFNMVDFARSECLKKRLSGSYKIDSFLFVPHFRGNFIYLEDSFHGLMNSFVSKIVSKIVGKMQNNLNIFYFAKIHQDTFRKKYNLVFEDSINYSVPIINNEVKEFDKERCSFLWSRKEFNILTISRFEFPHKGYIIGLVKAYNELKQEYPFVTLTIAGYGRDEDVLKEEMENLPSAIKKDIKMVGKISPNKMVDLYSNANVNVSVAGCYLEGVKNGTLSIPARHYSYTCEVYGLSPEANSYSVSSDSGKDVVPLLRKVINMSREEYLDYCEKSYYSLNANIENQRNNIFTIFNRTRDTISILDTIFIRLVAIIIIIRMKFCVK